MDRQAHADGVVSFFFCCVDQTEIPVEIPSGKLRGTWPELLTAAGAAEIIMRRIRHVGNADSIDIVRRKRLDVPVKSRTRLLQEFHDQRRIATIQRTHLPILHRFNRIDFRYAVVFQPLGIQMTDVVA